MGTFPSRQSAAPKNVEKEVMSQGETPSFQTSSSSGLLKNTPHAVFACLPPEDVHHIEQVDWGNLQPKTVRQDPCGCTAPSPGLLCCTDESCVSFACQEECGSNCVAQCGNRRIRNKQWKRVQVFDAGPKKGRGLRALEPIQKGEFIIEYVGKAIRKKDLDSLFDSYQMERMLYVMSLDGDIYLDARKSGGLARYINHSCQPNCKVDRWKVSGVSRAALFATADIPTRGELTIDYKWIQKRGRAPTKCHCQSLSCRGTLELSITNDQSKFNAHLEGHWRVPKSIPEEDLVNRTVNDESSKTLMQALDHVELETAHARPNPGTDSEMHALTTAFAKSAAAECIMERTLEQCKNETKEKGNTLNNIVKETQFKEKKSPEPAKECRRSSKVAAPQDICTPSYKREKSLPRSSPHHSSAQSVSRSSGQFIPFDAKLIVEKCTAIPIPVEFLVPKFSEQFTLFDDISLDLCSNLSLVSRIVQYKHAVGNFEQAQVFCLQGLQYFRQQGLELLKHQQELVFPVVSEVVERFDGKPRVPAAEFPLDCELEFAEVAYTVCGLWALYATLLGQCKGELFNAFDPTARSLIEQAESLKEINNDLLSLRNLFQDLKPVFGDLKEASLMAKPGSLFRAEKIVYEHALCCPVAKLTSSIWIAYARFCVRASAEFSVDDTPIKTTLETIIQKGTEALDGFVPNSVFFVQWKDNAERSTQNELQSLLLCDKSKNIIVMESPSLIRYWHSPPIDFFSSALPVQKSSSSAKKRKSTYNNSQSLDDPVEKPSSSAVNMKSTDNNYHDKSKNIIVMESPSLIRHWHSTPIDFFPSALPVQKPSSSAKKRKSTYNNSQSLDDPVEKPSSSAVNMKRTDNNNHSGLLSGSTTSGSTLLTFAEAMMTGTDLPGSTLLSFAEALSTSSTLFDSCESFMAPPSKTLYLSAPQKPLQPSAPKKPLQPHVSFKNVPHVPSSTVIPEYSIERLRF